MFTGCAAAAVPQLATAASLVLRPSSQAVVQSSPATAGATANSLDSPSGFSVYTQHDGLYSDCFALCAAGVMDAVEKGYLKNMYFGIAQDAEATNLLEVGSCIHRCLARTNVWPLLHGADCIHVQELQSNH